MLKDSLETLVFTGTPTLFDLTKSVKSDVYILHISSPLVFYYSMKFC